MIFYIKQFGLFATIFLFCFMMNASTTNAAVLYDSSDIGAEYDIAGGATSGENFYFRLPTLSAPPSFPLSSGFYTDNDSIEILRLKRISGLSCDWSLRTPKLIDKNGNIPSGVIVSSGAASGDFCDYSIIGNTNGVEIAGIIYCLNGGCSNANGTMVLAGSDTNAGITVSGDNTQFVSGGFAFQLCDSGGCSGGFETVPQISTVTRIISFKPDNATTTTNPPYFELNAYINEEDLGAIKGIRLSFHNIDQNVLIIGALSPSDIILLDEDIENSGPFFFSTSTVSIADGNYRIEACIDRTFFGDDFGLIGGWIVGAFTDVDDCKSHQFIVGTSTFIGNVSQNLWQDTQDFFGNSTATSSEALARTCNPLSTDFGIRECTVFLLVPDPLQLSQTMTEARSAFLSRVPWGYFTRTIDIMSSQATSTLPSFTTNIQIGAGSDMTPASTTLTFDIADMVAGAGNLVDSIEAVGYEGVGFRTVFEDWIKGMVALLVILTIVADIAQSHRNEMADGNSREGKKLS